MTTFLDQATLVSPLTPKSDVSFLGSLLKLSLSFSRSAQSQLCSSDECACLFYARFRVGFLSGLACFTFVPSPAFRLVSAV